MVSLSQEKQLEQLLKDLELPTVSSNSTSSTLNHADLDLISSALSNTSDNDQALSKSGRARSLAYLVLAKLLQTKPGTESDVYISSVSTYLRSNLDETDLGVLHRALSLFSAIFQIEPSAGQQIIQSDGTVELVAGVLELEALALRRTANSGGNDKLEVARVRLGLGLAELFSHSLNAPACRPAIRTLALDWLNQKVKRSEAESSSETLRSLKRKTVVVCSVALTKLIKAESADPLITASSEEGTEPGAGRATDNKDRMDREIRELTDLFSKTVVSTGTEIAVDLDLEALSSALEGLAYTSSQPSVKIILCQDDALLKSLFTITSRLANRSTTGTTAQRKSGLSASYQLDAELDHPGDRPRETNSLDYGICTILLNLFSRRPALTAEQKQVEKLKKLASAGKAKQKMGETVGDEEVDDRIDSNEAVEERVRWAMKKGLTTCLVDLGKSDSARVKTMAGRLFLEVVTDAGNRAEVVRDGGFKSLLSIVASLLNNSVSNGQPGKHSNISPDALSALQALAKMLITLPPNVLFGVNPASTSLDTIRPLSVLLSHDSSTLLQKFETMMALTNLASIGPQVASRIFALDDGATLKIAEHLMLEDNELVRRAAVELVCNLLAADEAFCRYSGDGLEEKDTRAEAGVFSRLHMLLAMTNVYDLNTRLAASGALATLTQSSHACRTLLQSEDRQRKVMSMIFDMLSPPVARDGDEEDGDDIQEISTLEPDSGLIYRAVVLLANLLGYTSTLDTEKKDVIMRVTDQAGLPQQLLQFLASWTSPSSQTHPGKEVAETTIECLRIMKVAGIKLTM